MGQELKKEMIFKSKLGEKIRFKGEIATKKLKRKKNHVFLSRN